MPVLEMQESNWEPIPDDAVLRAEVLDVKETTKNFGDGDLPRFEFSFIIREEGDFEGRKLWGDTPQTFVDDPRCKLKIWAQEILGQQLPPKFKLDTDALKGLTCRVVVGLRMYEKNGEQVPKNFVTDVMRLKEDGSNYEDPF